MKSDFLLAVTQLSAEKGLPKEVVLGAVEAALVSAYRKSNFTLTQKIVVKISSTTGKVEVWAEKTVVERPEDSRTDISLEEARRVNDKIEVGDILMVESTPQNAGRIAAQTAKQVILQRLHEAEHSAILEEYTGREGEIINGTIQRVESGQIIVDLGRTEAILPVSEQVRNERYRIGQRLKTYLLEVARAIKGPRVVLSRSHPEFIRRLFELEIPEVMSGVVEIKAVAREAGFRSKVAVVARQTGIDPVGCCVGLRGIRIQNIVNELNGEKLDVVMWHADARVFISNALSPAQVLNVGLDEEEEVATVVVPDRQLSLAIGREGQNARLAAKLTGWRIDIKSASLAEAEKAEADKTSAKVRKKKPVEAAAEAEPEPVEEVAAVEAEQAEQAEQAEAVAEVEIEQEAVEESEKEAGEEIAVPIDEAFKAGEFPFALKDIGDKQQIRFAEDIMPVVARSGPRPNKKKKKVVYGKDRAEEGIRVKKGRRETGYTEDDQGS